MHHPTQNNITRIALRLFACLILLIAVPRSLLAQNTVAGALTGTVKDASGALVANANVTVTNEGTHVVQTTTTTTNGFYTVENLPDGDYTVAIAAQGFGNVTVHSIHLDPGQRRGQDVELKPGNVSSEVNVEADTVAVQTESPESGGTITAKEVSNLMLNGRNFQQLATLVPGVSSVNGTNSQVNAGYLGQTDLVVGGASSEQTTYTIDGMYDMTPTSLININITPSIDAIEEMRVLKNAYSAKYGYAGSGQILIDTKSGTDRYHGTAYEFLRNNGFAVARPFSLTGVPVTQSSLHYNIRGGTFGGRVPRLLHNDPTFFFVGAEWKTNHYASVLNSRSEFTPAIRGGDLSSSFTGVGALGAKTLTCDSFCQNLLAARGLSQAQCFHNDANGHLNQISTSCFDPASAFFINPANNFMPLPNLPQNNNTSVANYINTNPELDSQDDEIYRIDQHIAQKHLVTFRFMREYVNNVRPARNYNDPSPNPGAGVTTPALNMLLRWNWDITPRIINSAGVGYTDQKVSLFPTGNFTVPSGLFTQAFNNGDLRLPAVTIGSYWTWLGVGIQPNYSKTGDGVASDDLTWVMGKHILQFGGLYLWNILRVNASAFSQGNFGFSGIHTGDVAADFLLGFTATYSQSNVQRSGIFHQKWFELYAQDDWKATPRLTLSYGVRYSYFGATTKDGNDITNFVPSTFNTATAPAVSPTGAFTYNAAGQPLTSAGTVANYLTNGIVQACQGVPCGFTTPKKGLFALRVGFAYRLNSQGTASVHGGYGMGYTQVGMFQTSGLLSNNPYVSTPGFTNTQFSTPAAGSAGKPVIGSVSGLDAQYRPAMTQSWSLTVENEIIRRGILSIAYAGDKVDHIFSSNVDRNFPVPGTSTGSATCSASANNPAPVPQSQWLYDPCLNTGSVVSNYYRPYQGFGGIATGTSIGTSNYHGLQTGFVYRLTDLQLNAAYTFSKALGDQNQTAQGNLAYGFDSNIGFQNTYNPKADYGRPSYDRTHVFTAAYVYELPFFRHADNLILRELLSHWGTSGLLTAQSGFTTPVSISTPYAGLANRANQVAPLIRNSGSGKQKEGQAALYDYHSFALPSFGTFGNSQPGVLRGPKEVSFAAAVNKSFPIGESLGVQLRAEAFNVFNHVNINSINSTIFASQATTASSFGYAASAGDMRQMEFSARVSF